MQTCYICGNKKRLIKCPICECNEDTLCFDCLKYRTSVNVTSLSHRSCQKCKKITFNCKTCEKPLPYGASHIYNSGNKTWTLKSCISCFMSSNTSLI